MTYLVVITSCDIEPDSIVEQHLDSALETSISYARWMLRREIRGQVRVYARDDTLVRSVVVTSTGIRVRESGEAGSDIGHLSAHLSSVSFSIRDRA